MEGQQHHKSVQRLRILFEKDFTKDTLYMYVSYVNHLCIIYYIYHMLIICTYNISSSYSAEREAEIASPEHRHRPLLVRQLQRR